MIIVDMVSLKQRPKYVASLQIALALGLVSGGLGSILVQKVSWRVYVFPTYSCCNVKAQDVSLTTYRIFWANLPITFIPLILLTMVLHIREERKPFLEQIKSMDWMGIFLLSGSMTSLLYAILAGGDIYPWNSPIIVVLLVVGVVSLVAFILHEGFVAGKYFWPEPLIPLRLFANGTAAAGYLIVIVHAIVLASLAFDYPLYVPNSHPSINTVPLTNTVFHR
jgi:MFS family permease